MPLGSDSSRAVSPELHYIPPMSRRNALIVLAAAVALHVLLALGFALRTPFRTAGVLLGQSGRPQIADVGAPDERQHATQIARYSRGEVPVFDPKDPNLGENYQAHQPPLYYAVSSFVAHGEPTIDRALAYRWPNLFFGALAVAGVFAFGWLATGRWEVAAGLVAVAAPWPMLCALSGAVSNDPLLIGLCSWALAALMGARRDGWNLYWSLLFGTAAGLATLTKTTGIVLLPVGFLAAILFTGPWRNKIASLAVGLALPLPWLLRNQSLYGDPLALRAFNEAFVGSAQKSTILQVIEATTPNAPAETSYWVNWISWWSFRSLVGVFGYMDIWLNERGVSDPSGPNALYRGFLLLFIAALIGTVLWLRRGTVNGRAATIIGGSLLLLVTFSFVRFNMQFFQAQGRYLLPALAPLCAGLAGGIGFYLRRNVLLGGLLVGLVFAGTSLYALWRLPDEFAQRVEASSR